MKIEDRLAREAVERLLPPESPAFFDELWSRVEVDGRARSRRRRRIGIGAVAAMAAVVAAASVYAAPAIFSSARQDSSVADRTYSCAVRWLGTAYAVDVFGEEKFPNLPYAGAGVTTLIPAPTATKTVSQVWVRSIRGGVTIDSERCGRSSRPVSFRAASRLPRGDVTRGVTSARCISTARVLVRAQVRLVAGVPTRAQIAVVDGTARLRPLAYLVWTPHRVTPRYGSSCVSTVR